MSNLRNTQAGTFVGTTLYKVRHKHSGLFFKPEYRNPVWEEGGRSYKTLAAARSAARGARERNNTGGFSVIPAEDLEIVEYQTIEAQTHNV
jgi:hypothetical protein